MNTIYLAPLQGLTDKTYRTIYPRHFSGVSKMFTPFELGDTEGRLKSFPVHRMLPCTAEDIQIIPQLISSDPKQFVKTANMLFDEGFHEVNLNMGCPSPTVVRKGRGAGMLANPAVTDAFFRYAMEKLKCPLSIKIRTGIRYHDEINETLNIYNQYDFSEIVLHPRTMEQQYEGTADIKAFMKFSCKSRNRTVYNGDVLSKGDFNNICRHTGTSTIMIGRGIIINPFLPEEIMLQNHIPDREKLYRLKNFVQDIMETYSENLCGETQFLSRIKEFWNYQCRIFRDDRKIFKKLKKISTAKNMFRMTEEIFSSSPELNDSSHSTLQNQYQEAQ